MPLVSNIKSKTWCISLLGSGVIAEGLASLRQCIDIILRTSIGTDPLRPLFGSNVYKYQDAPIDRAIPNIKKSIIEALAIWEKRIKVVSINHILAEAGHVEYEIVYLVLDEGLTDSIIFNPGGTIGTTTSNFIVQGLIPIVTGTSNRFHVEFKINNSIILPTEPVSGFATIAELFAWVQINWASYGTWHLLSDRIQCYLNPGTYVQASLTLSAVAFTTALRLAAPIPELTIGDSYTVTFSPDSAGLSLAGSGFYSKEEILSYAIANWSAYGHWAVEYNPSIDGTFSDDFSDDFETSTAGYVLVLYGASPTAVLEVTTT